VRLAEIAQEFPLTYYGWRAAAIVDPFPPGSASGARQGPPAPQPALPSKLPDRTVTRARILIEANLLEDAARELNAIRKEARHRADRLLLADLLQDAGDYHRAERLVLDAYLLELAQGPKDAGAELWWTAWPEAFAPYVEAATRSRRVDTELLYAVMREESGYRPKVLSTVGARGLAQIMPETGQRLAKQLGYPTFHPDDLLVPKHNLDLAGHYLESLLARFSGRTSAAVASYNAGPGAVTRWLEADGELPDDVWVESIPYRQTRTYVKRVLRSVHAYRMLY